MNNELKSCPFCGGKAEVKTNYEYGKARGYFIFCTKCDLQQPKAYSTKKTAIKIWNRRIKNG